MRIGFATALLWAGIAAHTACSSGALQTLDSSTDDASSTDAAPHDLLAHDADGDGGSAGKDVRIDDATPRIPREHYYLTTVGSGDNLNDTDPWVTAPSSPQNAMSVAQFNDALNWSTLDDSDKLDPGDIVYVKGDGWNSTSFDLKPRGRITLDFYEDGDYDPSGNWDLEPRFRNSKIFVDVDGVTIQDGRFEGRSLVFSNSGVKVRQAKVTRNYIWCKGGRSSIQWGFVCDSELSHNYADAVSGEPGDGGNDPAERFFVMNGGSRNRIAHNAVYGGRTSILLMHARTWDPDIETIDIPPSGAYAADPDFNMEDNEIAHNFIERKIKGQEGISYDVNSHERAATIVERDIVSAVNGRSIALSHADWSGRGNLYSGYYMTLVQDTDEEYGNHSLIDAHDGRHFTLARPIDGLSVGDTVVIGLAFRHNWIHHNTISEDDKGFATSGILIEGMGLANLVENNVAHPRSGTDSGFKVSGLTGYTKAFGNVTGTHAFEPCAFNIVRNNTAGRIINILWRKEYGPQYVATGRNDATYDNNLREGVKLAWVRTYVSGNEVIEPVSSETRSDDPTASTDAYFANWNPTPNP